MSVALPEHVGQDAILIIRIGGVELMGVELIGFVLLVVASFMITSP